MRVIVTGGSGLIGRALTRMLAEAGHEVVILSRSPGRVTDLPANTRAVGWDARSAAGWADEADGAGAIVNLAGENIAGDGFLPERWTEEKRHRIRQSRLNAGRAVVEAVAAAENKPGVVVQSSAIGYYGVHGDEKLTEDAPAGDDFLASVCVEWEASTAPVKEHGVRHAVIRTGLLLSTQGGPLPRLLLPYKLFAGGPFGNGQQWWSWIHLEDEVRAIRFLIEQNDARGPFNLTAPNPHKNKEFGKILGDAMGRPSWAPVPGFAMRAAFGDVATVVLDGQRVLPHRLQELGFTFKFPQLAPALQDLLEREI